MQIPVREITFVVSRKRMSQVTVTVRNPMAISAVDLAVSTMTNDPLYLRKEDNSMPPVQSVRSGDSPIPSTSPTASAGAPVSTGAIVGIAVGCVVLAVVLVLVLIWYRKHRQVKRKATMMAGIQSRTVADADRLRNSMQKDSAKENSDSELSKHHPEVSVATGSTEAASKTSVATSDFGEEEVDADALM